MSVSAGRAWTQVVDVLFGNDSYVKALTTSFGVADDAIRVFLSLLAGYPLAFLYRSVFYGRSPTIQHLYFIVCGIYMGYFNFGLDILHSLANLVFIYILMQVTKGTRMSVAIAFVVNTGYLLIGCATSGKTGDQYRIEWTTSHCVFILKLTAVIVDLHDGRKKKEELSLDQQLTALHQKPSLLELMGHCYYFGGFLVGPQCSMKRYLTLVGGGYSIEKPGYAPNSVIPGLKKLCIGLVYIALLQILAFYFPTSYLFTSYFQELPLLFKCVYVLFWGRCVLTRYIAIWHISEGICILTGITYDGKDSTGKALWDGCCNMKLWDFETCHTLGGIAKSFNCQTNSWMVRYVMKKLKFLGNKMLSKLITLLYLALWHGPYSGYFNSFILEFILVFCESEIIGKLTKVFPQEWDRTKNKWWMWVIARMLYCQFFWSYSLLSFELLMFEKYWQVYTSMYFIGHFCHLLAFFVISAVKFTPKSVMENGVRKEK